MRREVLIAVGVWAGLLLLLALTVAVTFAPIGPLRTPASLAIATVKAGLIAWFYMHLREQGGLIRVFALAALAWLALLFTLGGIDVLGRGWFG